MTEPGRANCGARAGRKAGRATGGPGAKVREDGAVPLTSASDRRYVYRPHFLHCPGVAGQGGAAVRPDELPGPRGG